LHSRTGDFHPVSSRPCQAHTIPPQRIRRLRLSVVLKPSGAVSLTGIVKVQPMLPLKSIVKGTLNGALVFALIGIFVGAVVAMIVWPGSNLGPPVGMVYGFFWGAIIGGVLGFAYAMIRLSIRKPAVAHENLENHKAP